MGYAYRGDYYRGDYYRGDIWGLVGKIGRGIADIGGGILSGHPLQGVGAAIGEFGGGSPNAGGTSQPPSAPGTGIARLGPTPMMPVPRALPPGSGETAGGVVVASPRGMVPAGYHWNKSNEYCNGVIVTPKHTKLVRNRSMNPTNVRALRRADRRAHGFLRIARSVTRHYVAKQPKGRAYVHTRRRRK
jgi:hypothetical protein